MRLDLPFVAATMFGTPHMIRAAKFNAIADALAPRLLGGAMPVGAYDDEAPVDDAPPVQYAVTRGGVAVVKVLGTLVRRGGWLDAMSGLTSYDGLRACLRAALADPDVRAVMLELDSHGGEAGGVFDLADWIKAASKRAGKPIWAHANENAASAAYAIASPCDQIWLARTAEVGSIGVVCAHVDQSKADEKAGLKWTFIYEGDHKTHGNPHEPLADAAREAAQASAHELYEMFVDQVSQYRGMTAQAVRDTKADTYRGQSAVDAGLADRVGTLDQAISALAKSVDKPSTPSGGKLQNRGPKWRARPQTLNAAATASARKAKKS